MKNTIKLSEAQLVEMLTNWKFGAQPASLQYKTTPKLIKEGKTMFGTVTKIANIGCMIGYKYENSVNNQLEREGEMKNFMAQPLWKGAGKRISTALSFHEKNDVNYLTYKKQQTFKSFHFDSVLNFIPLAMLKPYFPKSDPSKYQGVAKPVYHREIKIANILKLKFKKTTYEIVRA